MLIEVHPPISFSEKGSRSINEDYVRTPEHPDTTASRPLIFLVCDGVGGEAKGEIASRLTAKTVEQELAKKRRGKDVRQAVVRAQEVLTEYTHKHQDSKGMATTLALLVLDRSGATLAHLGDSRIYQFRAGVIHHRTTDHSFVQELLDNKLITQEQADHHPRRNVITRAVMQGPDLIEPEVSQLTDLAKDDIFLLCTDGVNETFSDEDLLAIINDTEKNDVDRMAEIKRRCAVGSRDNYTACLVRIQNIGVSDWPYGDSENPVKGALKSLLYKLNLIKD